MIWLALFVTLSLWWLFTGLALISAHQRPPIKNLLFGLSTIVAIGCIASVPYISADPSLVAVLFGFLFALLIWAWLELMFLMGIVTGPNKSLATQGRGVGQKFKRALATMIYHEVVVISVIGLTFFLGGEQPTNPIIFYVLLVLWIMRCSTKLNLFFGVRHFNHGWLPKSHKHVASYVSVGKNSALMTPSSSLAAIFAALLFSRAFATDDTSVALSLFLLAWVAALAAVEHVFLMYRVGEEALWRWAVKSE